MTQLVDKLKCLVGVPEAEEPVKVFACGVG